MLIINLYHGTISHHKESFETKGIILKNAKPKTDFGKGFYLSNTESFARETAKAKALKTNNKNKNALELPLVLRISYDDKKLDALHLSYRRFEKVDEEWLRFVIYSRVNPEIKAEMRKLYTFKEYDIISGPIADMEVTTLVSEIDHGLIHWQDVKLENILPYRGGTDIQYAFRTEKALSCLTIDKYDIILGERM